VTTDDDTPEIPDDLPPFGDDEGPDNVIAIGTAKARRKATPAAGRPLLDWESELLELLIVTRTTDRSGEEKCTLRACAANVATILQHHPSWRGVVALNVFHLRIEARTVPPWNRLDAPADLKAGPWSDADTARLANWFARTWICGMPPMHLASKMLEPGILVAAEACSYHPVRDYLTGIVWDGEKRIDTFVANYLGGELTPYACAVGAAFLIGCVARVMAPGCKLDTCIVLEGKQGKFKSTALEVLAGEWFADSKLDIGAKDGMQGLAGVWLYELGELASFGKADVETIKAFMSSRRDHYRPSYGKHAIDVPRQTAFAGSTNAGQYLQDETGGRRFNPIVTGRVNIPALRRDRDQLWAEALHRYEGGSPWWLDEALTAPEQAARFVPDEWQGRIAAYLRLRTSTTVGDILGDLIFHEVDANGQERNSIGRWNQREQTRVARCLTQLGWFRKRQTTGSREWHYVRLNQGAVPAVPVSADESGTEEPQ
jgi:predicted P-loop ATPase